MSSKRALRRKACDGKTRYGTFAAAAKALRGFRRYGGVDGWPRSAYPCSFCGGFHFGHVPAEQLKARARR
jgi:hypothetical protein